MQSHEYLALPAPDRSPKVKGLKTQPERFAHQVTALLNELAAEGWEFWRSECLPSEERKGLTGTRTVQNHLLIFRRPRAEALAEEMARASSDAAPGEEPAAAAEPPTIRPPQPLSQVHDTRREPAFLTRRVDADTRE